MTTFQHVLNGIAGVLILVAVGVYIVAIVRKTTRPAKATWIIWTVLSFLTAGGMFQSGTLNGQMVAVVAGDVVVVVLALIYGIPGWNTLDKLSLAGAGIGLAFWVATSNPLYAIVISLSINFIGAIPTVVKTWKYPDQESPTTWVLVGISSTLQSIAIPAWTTADAAQPLSYLVIQGALLFLIFVRPKQRFAETWREWKDTKDKIYGA